MRFLIAAGLLCAVAAVVIGLVTGAVARARQSGARSRFIDTLGGPGRVELSDAVANCFGIQSLGRKQVRGNGTLVLTHRELAFEQWVPNRVLRVRRSQLTRVDTCRSFLGKTRGSRLLRVAWNTEDGHSDRAAWQVRDLDAWLRALGDPDARGRATT